MKNLTIPVLISLLIIANLSSCKKSKDAYVMKKNGKNYLIFKEKVKPQKMAVKQRKLRRIKKMNPRLKKELKAFMKMHNKAKRYLALKHKKRSRKLFVMDAIEKAMKAIFGDRLKAERMKNRSLKLLVDTHTIANTLEKENSRMLIDTRNDFDEVTSFLKNAFGSMRTNLERRSIELEEKNQQMDDE